jgi:3,4-dihydroxy 2-butanone 4-phosphate synthase/GTP cyclohydrolase II
VNSISELIADFKVGRFVILVDDEDRENEGDLILAADFITPEAVNFLAKEARGLICLAMSQTQIEKLQLPMMSSNVHQASLAQTAFTVSIEASTGVTTGISAADRAHTIKVASNPKAKPSDVIVPGHIFPLRAHPGGVLARAGHTEASIDLARYAGLNLASVICEVINEDGSMARVPDLKIFADQFNIKIGTIADLIEYRRKNQL